MSLCLGVAVTETCNEHGVIPCRVFVNYDTGDNVEPQYCHNFCWGAQGDDGYWCIKSSTQQCVCFYNDNCGCPPDTSVEDDCTNPALKNSESFHNNSATSQALGNDITAALHNFNI